MGVLRLFNDALGHSHSASGHTDCKFLLVAHSAIYWSAHHIWQTRFFNVPSEKHWYTWSFSYEEQYISPFSNFSWSKGDRTRKPCVGSRVFYGYYPFNDIELRSVYMWALPCGYHIMIYHRSAGIVHNCHNLRCKSFDMYKFVHISEMWRTKHKCNMLYNHTVFTR